MEKELMQVLWNYRHINPSMSVRVNEADEEAFKQCCEFHEVVPKITVVRREANKDQGKPAYFVVAITDQHGNAIIPIENNDKDYEEGAKARRRQEYSAEARDLASRAKNNAMRGDMSSDVVIRLADTVLAVL